MNVAVLDKLKFFLILIIVASTGCSEGTKTEPSTPTTIVANTETDRSSYVGFTMVPSPSVTVRDQNGNPFSGASVQFSLVSGDGTITGASTVTDTLGVAAVGSWTIGLTPGPNVLVARSGTLSVTFKVTGISKCEFHKALDLGSSGGILEENDCPLPNGAFVDFFEVSLSSASAYLFRENSTMFNTYLRLSLTDASVIAENDDQTATSLNSAIKALLPAGTYLLGASSLLPNVKDVAYTVGAQVTSTDNAGCERVFVVRNVSTNQNVAATDCLWNVPPAAPIYADKFQILLKAGQSVTVSMTSTTVDSYIEIQNASGTIVAQNDNRDATTNNAQITFTPAVTSYYTIVARTAGSSQGQYNLMIQ